MLSVLKKVTKHTIVYGIGILFGKAIGFFLIPLYTHYLNPGDYGILELLDLTSFIVGEFLAMGLSESILRYYPNHPEGEERNVLVSTALIFSLISGGVITLIMFRMSGILARVILTSSEYRFLFIILSINMFLGSVILLMKSTIRAQQKSVFYTGISLVTTAIAISFNIFFVAFLKLGLKGILYSSLISSSLICFYLLVVTFRSTGISFSKSKLVQMLKYGLPFLPNGILMFIFNWSDRYILRIYCDMTTIGLYALGYRISMILVFLISMPFNLIWRAHIFDIEKKPDAKAVYSRVATYYLSALTLVALLIATLSREIIVILANPSYLNAYRVIPLIVLSMFFMCSGNVFQIGILLKKKTGYLPAITGVAAGTNILLNFLLIPQYEMMGAAFATVISFFVYIVGIYVMAQRFYPIPFEFRRIGKVFFGATAIFFVVNRLAFENAFLSLTIKGLSSLLALALILYLSGFVLPEERAQVVRGLRLLKGRLMKPFTK